MINWKDLEGNDRVLLLLQVLSGHLALGSEEDHEEH
jgi:hypothetical protein